MDSFPIPSRERTMSRANPGSAPAPRSEIGDEGMSGPDFQIPSTEPARPADSQVPLRPKRSVARRVRASALWALVAVGAGSAVNWSSTQETPAPTTAVSIGAPSGSQTTRVPWPTTSSTLRTTTTTRAVTLTRTCFESAEDPEAANGWTPEGFPLITFHVSPRVGREALVRIAQHASDARQAFGDAGALGVRIYCDIQELATASNKTPEVVQKEVANGGFAYHLRGDMWLYGPSFEKYSALSQRKTVFHEYFHAMQRSLSRSRSTFTSTRPPLWMIEGSAEFFENAATARGLEDFRRTQVRRWDGRPALEELEQSGGAQAIGGNGDAYIVGAVATDYLVTTYGRDRIQTEFWAALAETDWRSAFVQVFGVSLDAFYSEFAGYRQTLRA